MTDKLSDSEARLGTEAKAKANEDTLRVCVRCCSRVVYGLLTVNSQALHSLALPTFWSGSAM